MRPVITLDDIRFARGQRFTLSVDHLELQEERIYILTGPNGAGKSTLLRVMALLAKPQRGKVSIGLEPRGPLSRQRRLVSLVDQAPYLFHGTVEENLAYGLKLRGVDSEERNRRIGLTLSIVGLEGFESRKTAELSGGEVQRVALARALVFKPQLLLLDEPTANIDSDSLQAFEALISKLPRYGVTVVCSTHDLAQTERLSGEVLRIENGRLLTY